MFHSHSLSRHGNFPSQERGSPNISFNLSLMLFFYLLYCVIAGIVLYIFHCFHFTFHLHFSLRYLSSRNQQAGDFIFNYSSQYFTIGVSILCLIFVTLMIAFECGNSILVTSLYFNVNETTNCFDIINVLLLNPPLHVLVCLRSWFQYSRRSRQSAHTGRQQHLRHQDHRRRSRTQRRQAADR